MTRLPEPLSPSQDESIEVEDQTATLIRYYVVTAWFIAVILTLVGGLIAGEVAKEKIIQEAGNQNVAYANQISHLFQALILNEDWITGDEISEPPDTPALRQELQDQSRNLPITRVRLYSTRGLVLFSTEPADVGQYTNDELFPYFRWHTQTAELTHHEAFNGLNGAPVTGHMVSTFLYVGSGTISDDSFVIQVFQDVTPSLQRMRKRQAIGTGGILSIVTLPFGFALVLEQRLQI